MNASVTKREIDFESASMNRVRDQVMKQLNLSGYYLAWEKNTVWATLPWRDVSISEIDTEFKGAIRHRLAFHPQMVGVDTSTNVAKFGVKIHIL